MTKHCDCPACEAREDSSEKASYWAVSTRTIIAWIFGVTALFAGMFWFAVPYL